MSHTFGEKRTRSQLVLPDFDFSLQESPLKNARTALKNSQQLHSHSERMEKHSELSSDATPRASPRGKGGSDLDIAGEDTDDELLLSPKKRNPIDDLPQDGAMNGTKRASSPMHNDNYPATSSGSGPRSPSVRASKRARRELEILGEASSANTKSRNTVGPPRACSEPRLNLTSRHKRRQATPSSSKRPVSAASTSSPTPFQYNGKVRASSVPIFPPIFAPTIPHLDLNNLPPSPQRARSRSSSKERESKLRIVSNPVLGADKLDPILDESLMDVDTLPPSYSEPVLPTVPERSVSSPLTELEEPATPPPATSSPDLIDLNPQDQVTDDATTNAVNCMNLSPLTPAVSTPTTPSPISPLSPLPDVALPVSVDSQATPTAKEVPQPEGRHATRRNTQAKSRLPRPLSTVDLASKASSSNQTSSKQVRPVESTAEFVKGKGKQPAIGLAAPSKPAAQSKDVPSAERNAFTVLMASGKSKPANSQPKAKGRSSTAAVTSNLQARKRGEIKPEMKPPLASEKQKTTIKSKMRPREKPKPVLVVPASLLPQEEEEELDENNEQPQPPSPAMGLMSQQDPRLNPGLVPSAPVRLADKIIEPAGDGLAPNIAVEDEESPNMEAPEASALQDATEPHSLLNNEADVESTNPHSLQTPADPMSTAQEDDHSTSEHTDRITSKPAAEPSHPSPEASPTTSKRKRAALPRRSIPNNSPRRVTRSVSNQQRSELGAATVSVAEQCIVNASGSSTAKSQSKESAVAGEPADPPIDPPDAMLVSAPDSPAKANRRSLGRRSSIVSKIPQPKTPMRTKIDEPKPLHQSPSKLARASSMLLPRHSVGAAGPSSLSNLSEALDKLRMPPPSRPNTSMGFNRDADNSDTEGEVSKTVDDSAIQRSNSLKRAATLDTSALLTTTVAKKSASATAGKVKSGNFVQKPMTNFFAPRAGDKAGNRSHLLPPASGPGPRIFGFGRGRIAPRASKKTTLPSVMASPVKGGDDTGEDDVGGGDAAGARADSQTQDVFMAPPLPLNREDVDEDMASILDGKGKEPQRDPHDGWRKNASRRASLALQGLSQSLSSLPNPSAPGLLGAPATPRGTRSSSSSYPSTGAIQPTESENNNSPPSSGRMTRSAAAKSAPGALGKIKAGSGGHVSSSRKDPGDQDSNATSETLSILEDCTVFLDVRTDEGEDAGELFLEMLQRLGARILSRVGQTCTHIVYKNGLSSTVGRWRKLKNKPHVVGIAWVVECAERREKADETPYLIDLEGVNVAGVVKRRRSMLPRFIARELEEEVPQQAEGSEQVTSSVDETPSSMVLEDDLPPLEILRRRTLGVAS